MILDGFQNRAAVRNRPKRRDRGRRIFIVSHVNLEGSSRHFADSERRPVCLDRLWLSICALDQQAIADMLINLLMHAKVMKTVGTLANKEMY